VKERKRGSGRVLSSYPSKLWTNYQIDNHWGFTINYPTDNHQGPTTIV